LRASLSVPTRWQSHQKVEVSRAADDPKARMIGSTAGIRRLTIFRNNRFANFLNPWYASFNQIDPRLVGGQARRGRGCLRRFCTQPETEVDFRYLNRP
jgi:hypothetical protein